MPNAEWSLTMVIVIENWLDLALRFSEIVTFDFDHVAHFIETTA